MRNAILFSVGFILVVTAVSIQAQRGAPAGRPPLGDAQIGDIARLLMLEDTRQFDEASLARLLASAHPEIRRRAALAIGRIADKRGAALLTAAADDKDAEVAATMVFAIGQLRDPSSVTWLSDVLSSPKTPTASAREAAIALGKIQAPEARAALARYLSTAPRTKQSAPVAGEALLSIGRFPPGGDLAPIVRWTSSPDVEVRWRAAWALFRSRDPAAIPHLLRLSRDPSGDVRFWAVRGLLPPAPATVGQAGAPAQVPPPPGVDGSPLSARLRDATRDPDRRVRTEALRALKEYGDDASFGVLIAALESPDTWLSVSAAEAMARYQGRSDVVVPALVRAAAPSKPMALRITALTPLVALAPDAALELAGALARDSSVVARTAARQAFGRLGAPGRAQLDALIAEGVLPAASAARPARAAAPSRTEADYRRIVERWIVPDYNGAPKPRAVWETPRGTIELELYPGDAPLGVEHFLRVVESGEIAGTEFGRVVPNFVAQQRAIRDDITLRDEVSRRGLTRGNLSWASAGLDTGRPGYTLGVTPQPHNEGNFTALGRVVSGMAVVERLELGDKIIAARMKR